MISFSVLMSVYRNDKADCVRTAVESVTIRQTLQPAEVILMVDGPVSVDLKQTINELEKQICYLKPVWLKENVGLGNILRIGMEYCTNELVARMDADLLIPQQILLVIVVFLAIRQSVVVIMLIGIP